MMADHKTGGLELYGMEERPSRLFLSDGVIEYYLISTGDLVLPTYPLNSKLAEELRK